MKKILFVCLSIMGIYSISHSQALKTNTEYVYDANGNRISASVIYLTTNLKSADIVIDSLLLGDTINTPKDGWKKPQTEIAGETEIAIFPNPTHGELIFKLNNIKQENSFSPNDLIYVWDINGKLILKQGVTSDYTIIDLSKQQNGSYLIKVNLSGTEKYFIVIKN